MMEVNLNRKKVAIGMSQVMFNKLQAIDMETMFGISPKCLMVVKHIAKAGTEKAKVLFGLAPLYIEVHGSVAVTQRGVPGNIALFYFTGVDVIGRWDPTCCFWICMGESANMVKVSRTLPMSTDRNVKKLILIEIATSCTA